MSMFSESMGAAYSLMTAVCWAAAVLLFKKSGESMTAVGLNYFKNVVALALLVLTLWGMGGRLLPDASVGDVLVLLVSGALGIGVADSLFFYGLNALGAGRVAIIECLYSPLVVLFSVLMLGEQLGATHLAGGALILLGVLLASVGPVERDAEKQRGRAVLGFFAAAASMALMAFAIVLAKGVLGRHEVIWATSVRMLGGVLTLTVLLPFGGAASRRAVLQTFLPQASWRFAIPASLVGSYLALILWIAGFKYTTATTASLLNQTSTLFIVVFAWLFLREPLTPAKALAMGLSFGGSVLVMW